MGRFSERKYFASPVDKKHAGVDCNFLTIGIGGDWQVEAEFKNKVDLNLPQTTNPVSHDLHF